MSDTDIDIDTLAKNVVGWKENLDAAEAEYRRTTEIANEALAAMNNARNALADARKSLDKALDS